MIVRDRLDVSASAAEVWDVLDDPALMELWNPKCVRCEVDREHVHVGLRYRASFRLHGPECPSDCEVMACAPGQLLTTRFLTEAPGPAGYVDETFRLQPLAQGTRIIHEVDFTHSGLPRWLEVFMKVMNWVGRQAGRSSLDGIKELVEKPEQ
ncbi:MAG: SRPBCC family protein [Phycisphaerales bacterium]|nr:MAG: SRPBCC family protein [Phycisphaerales bacterium]